MATVGSKLNLQIVILIFQSGARMINSNLLIGQKVYKVVN